MSIAVWEVQRDEWGWQMYDGDFCCILEAAYAKFIKNPRENSIAALGQNRSFDFEINEENDSTTGKWY